MEVEDERREAALASAQCLQPNYKPPGVSKAQLAKFQELHKRRLQIKERSKPKKCQGRASRTNSSKGKDLNEFTSQNTDKTVEDSSFPIPSSTNTTSDASSHQDNLTTQTASKKRQKLHWGLDAKERWERKSNM